MRTYLSFLIFAFFACNHATQSAKKPLLMSIDTSKYAFIKFDTSENYLFGKYAKPAYLSQSELNEVENLLDSAIHDYNRMEKKVYEKNLKDTSLYHAKASDVYDDRITDLSDYKKQLIAVINSSGEKLVWVNCFNNHFSAPYWQKTVVFVNDGGKWFFNIKINLTHRKAYELMINGSA